MSPPFRGQRFCGQSPGSRVDVWVRRKNDKRWTVLHYGVDFKPFAEPPDPLLRKRLCIPEGAFVVGHVGRFHEQKNQRIPRKNR